MAENRIVFTQYLRPNGRRKEVYIERPIAVATQAAQVKDRGYHFDIEELMNGMVSMTIEPNQPDASGDDAPIAHEICANGPDVPEAVDRLVATAAGKVLISSGG